MNFFHTKSLASLLTRWVLTSYSVLAALLMLLQIYFLEHTQVSIVWMLIELALTTVGLWFILHLVTKRFLVRPLQKVIDQVVFFDGVEAPKSDLDSTAIQEITDLHNAFRGLANKSLAIQKEAAEALQRAKVRFLAAASHDLRQPMHAFNLYLASFAETEMSKPLQTCVENLNRCAKAMNDMLDTLLDISNIDAGATKVHPGIFPIASPIERVQAEFQPLASAKGIVLRVARCSAFVESDEDIVERILRHLLSNAVRYTERGKILIGCRRRGTQLRLVVYDTGLGIALDKQKEIFEAHFQLNNDERNRAKGLGLGLSIVQRLTKLLKTSITLHSRPGMGSSFAFDLPAVDLNIIEPVKLGLSKNLESVLDTPFNLSILVIDDEPLILDATRTILESWGYTVIIGRNGQEALNRLKQTQQQPDVILCDYLLADGEKGVELVRTIRAVFGKEIPAFLVTGITSPDYIQAIQDSGLNYLFKPLNYEQLRITLSQFTPLNYG